VSLRAAAPQCIRVPAAAAITAAQPGVGGPASPPSAAEVIRDIAVRLQIDRGCDNGGPSKMAPNMPKHKKAAAGVNFVKNKPWPRIPMTVVSVSRRRLHRSHRATTCRKDGKKTKKTKTGET